MYRINRTVILLRNIAKNFGSRHAACRYIHFNTYYSKRLNKKRVWSNHRSLWFTTESFSPIMEITKIYQLQIFSCLFTFYSSLSRICWKNKCYKKQVPSKIFTLLRCLEINFYVNFHNQLKKVWNVNFWGQNSGLNFHKNVETWWKLRPLFWPQKLTFQTFFN